MSAMRLFKCRVSTDDPKIHDSRARRRALRSENYSQGVLLPGLPLSLEQPGRAYDRTAVASVLSRKRSEQGRLIGDRVVLPALDSSQTTLPVLQSHVLCACGSTFYF